MPSQREKRRLAILRSDRSLWIFIAPKIRTASNVAAVLWALVLVYTLAVEAEGSVLLAVLAVPVGLFWITGRLVTRIAAYVDKNWS
jgi:hypothetical protein